MSVADESSSTAPVRPWQRIETWLDGHRGHFDYLTEELAFRRYGRHLVSQGLRIEPAPSDPHQLVVFGPDGAGVHPVRGWASTAEGGTAGPMYPAILDRVRQTLWMPEAHGRIVLLVDPYADRGQQNSDVDRLLAHLEAVEQQRRTEFEAAERQRRTEQMEQMLAPVRQMLLRNPRLSQRLRAITTVLIVVGLIYLLFLPGPGKNATFVVVALASGLAWLIHTTEKIRRSP